MTMSKIDFPKRPVPFLGYFLKSLTAWQKTSIFLVVTITMAVSISNVLMMYGFKLLIDDLPSTNPTNVWNIVLWPFGLIIGCCVFHTVMYRVRDMVDMNAMPYILNSLREMLMGNIIRHSHDFFHNRFSGELANKIGNVVTAYRNLMWDRLIHGFIPTLSSIISSAVLLYMVDPIISAILVAVVVGLCSSIYAMAPSLGRASANVADREADISGQLVDTLTNISSVKNFANHRHEMGLLGAIQRPYIRAYKRLVWWEIFFWAVFDVFISSLVIGFVWYLIANYAEGQYTAGDVAVCTMIAWDVWYRMAHLSWQLSQLSGDLGRMESALNEFVRPLGVEDKPKARPFTPHDGSIVFNNVGFVYENGRSVFEGFHLTIPASQKVGLIGLSGAGKTTLCQLLLRSYDVTTGTITIGGDDIAAVTQESLRHKVAVIPQDPTLFHRTLRENILYGKPDASEDEMIAAAKAAQAHDFILATSDGYDTMVGERGVKLSGGQRQRIAIARAILKNAPILILDEATSALDSDTERLIQTALDTAMEGRTTIVVAHRLSTLAHLDRLLVLKDGVVIEDGTLSELMTQNGHFAYLWNLQAGGFLPEKL